ncbi:hypothetical protein [Rhizobium oryzicola]|uniref:Nucleotidyltransferase family protein n=1 Tax=Rhizobium oryzicola TaxID=1232668 RepID=A0ABT8SYJ1_9HYPH|nr:hypothetical protein [Rhizobium oryzicola]MDO1583041.1 hypothetical protein [Rhizobium oryzicola]
MEIPVDDDLFRQSLENVARLLNEQEVPWLVFGGAAMVLYGLEKGPVADIDVIISATAAARLSEAFSWHNHADGRSARFRSDYLLRPNLGPVPVELLGGFCISTASGWAEISVGETRAHRVGSEVVFLPTPQGLAALFRLCGREKDHRRAGLIESAVL